jgi:hypothetical protein
LPAQEALRPPSRRTGVANRPVDREDAGGGWWMLAIDTPLGPLAFAAKSAIGADLVDCAPPDTVPPARSP